MAVITRLVKAKGRSRRVRVYLDGRYAFSLEDTVAARLKLRDELDETRIEALGQASQREHCWAAAEHYLANRPHSRKELEQKLGRRGFDEATVSSVLSSLAEHGVLDDAEFAAFWCDNREAFRPGSKRLAALELAQKGVDQAVIARTTGALDDADSAYRAAAKRARLLQAADYDTFSRRLGDFLRRRGFGYEVARNTVERLWQEKGNSAQPS